MTVKELIEALQSLPEYCQDYDVLCEEWDGPQFNIDDIKVSGTFKEIILQ